MSIEFIYIPGIMARDGGTRHSLAPAFIMLGLAGAALHQLFIMLGLAGVRKY